MPWNQIANLKGPKGADGVGGVGSSAWADITGKPGLLGADGWSILAIPQRYTALCIGGEIETQEGTVGAQGVGDSSLRASLPRWELKGNGAVNGNAGQVITPNNAIVSHSGSAVGGFTYRARVAVTSALATQRGFVGLLSYPANSSGDEPYNGPDNIGLAFNAGVDANYQMVCHPYYGVLTKQDAGAGFAIGNANAVLEIVLKNAPGSGIVTWKLRDLNSGANAAGAFTANLPGPAVRLGHKHFMNNNGIAGVVSMELISIYIGRYIPD